MSEIATNSVYLVDAYSDPVLVRITGRASFQNSGCLRDFFVEMRRQGKDRFVLDFRQCVSMDSTFLGVLAGVALELRKSTSAGSLVLVRVAARNLELIRNLGLHRLLTIDTGNDFMAFATCDTPIKCRDRSEMESARLVLEAHETLVSVDEGNRVKFQDVLAFLKDRLEQGEHR